MIYINLLQITMILVAVAVLGTFLIYAMSDLSSNNMPSPNSTMYKTAKTNADLMALLGQFLPFIILAIALIAIMIFLTRWLQ